MLNGDLGARCQASLYYGQLAFFDLTVNGHLITCTIRGDYYSLLITGMVIGKVQDSYIIGLHVARAPVSKAQGDPCGAPVAVLVAATMRHATGRPVPQVAVPLYTEKDAPWPW